MTAFLVIRDHDEAVTAVVVEPRTAIAHVTYRPGRRHPVTRGAPGIALLAGRPALPDEREEIAVCRARGWAFSESEVLPGMKACSAPVIAADGSCTAAVSVVFVGAPDLEVLGARVILAAGDISARSDFIGGARG
jgi:DNA-binding IclR family transcriptional regulator